MVLVNLKYVVYVFLPVPNQGLSAKSEIAISAELRVETRTLNQPCSGKRSFTARRTAEVRKTLHLSQKHEAIPIAEGGCAALPCFCQGIQPIVSLCCAVAFSCVILRAFSWLQSVVGCLKHLYALRRMVPFGPSPR